MHLSPTALSTKIPPARPLPGSALSTGSGAGERRGLMTWEPAGLAAVEVHDPRLACMVRAAFRRSRSSTTCLATFLALLLSACTASRSIQIDLPVPQALPLTGQATAGASKVDLTAPPGMPMGGYASTANRGQGFRTRLKARILYLNDGRGQSMALIQADWIAGSLLVHHLVASRVAEQTGLLPEQIVITASHTHSAPANFFENDFYNKHTTSKPWLSAEHVEFAVTQLSSGILEAHQKQRPARIAIGVSKVYGLSRNRSMKAYVRNANVAEIDLKNPEARFQAINPELNMIRVDALDDDGKFKPLAAFSSFSMHNTTLSAPVQVYNAEVYGFAQRDVEWELEERHQPSWKVVHALAQATVGDMAPAIPERGDNWLSHAPVDWIASRELGKRLGDKALELFDALEHKLSPKLQLAAVAREVNIRENNLIGDIENCKDPAVGNALAAGAYERRLPGFTLVPSFRGGHVLARRQLFTGSCQGTKKHLGTPWLQALVEAKDSYPQVVMFQLLKINGMVILPLPFEVTVESGRRMTEAVRREFEEAKEPLSSVWVASVANGYFGYATTPEEYAWQNYEGGHTLYGKNTSPFLSAHLQQLSRDFLKADAVSSWQPSWEYQLRTANLWTKNREPEGKRKWLEHPTAHFARKPHEENHVRVRWLDVNSSRIEFHKPLLSLEHKVGGEWRTLKVGNHPIDDEGYDLEVRLLKDTSEGMAHYEARWYNPVPGGEFRFVIAPRDGQDPLLSPEFSWNEDSGAVVASQKNE